MVWTFARAHNRHLAFGHGHHFCLGSVLARMEGEAASALCCADSPISAWRMRRRAIAPTSTSAGWSLWWWLSDLIWSAAWVSAAFTSRDVGR